MGSGQAALGLVLALGLLAATACGLSADVSRELGARCDSHDECDERCISSYPGGFCSLSCDDDDDCPATSACVDVEAGVCLFTCELASDCEFLGPGWSCQQVNQLPTGEVMACIGTN